MKKIILIIVVVVIVFFAGLSTYSYSVTSANGAGDPFLWLTYSSKYDWRRQAIPNITKKFPDAPVIEAEEAYAKRDQLVDKLIIIEGEARLGMVKTGPSTPENPIYVPVEPICFAGFTPSRCKLNILGFTSSKFDSGCYSCGRGFYVANIPLPYSCHSNANKGEIEACELKDGATYRIAGYWRFKIIGLNKAEIRSFEAIGYEKL